ncbi:MAG: AraC family transcriptional regulator, partial [Bacillota bacterium]
PVNMDGIELFSARIEKHCFSKHMHDAYTIGINDRGQGSYMCNGSSIDAYTGNLNLINPGEIHTGKSAEGSCWVYRDIYISTEYMHDLAYMFSKKESKMLCFRKPSMNISSLYKEVSYLFNLLNSDSSRLEKESRLIEVMLLMLFNCCSDGSFIESGRTENKAVNTIKEYVQEYYNTEVALADLANITGLNPYYLIRVFAKEMNMTPHLYLKNVRLNKAKKDLSEDISLIEISLKHGYYDQSHFLREFKSAFGFTPGQYRRAIFYNTNN